MYFSLIQTRFRFAHSSLHDPEHRFDTFGLQRAVVVATLGSPISKHFIQTPLQPRLHRVRCWFFALGPKLWVRATLFLLCPGFCLILYCILWYQFLYFIVTLLMYFQDQMPSSSPVFSPCPLFLALNALLPVLRLMRNFYTHRLGFIVSLLFLNSLYFTWSNGGNFPADFTSHLRLVRPRHC